MGRAVRMVNWRDGGCVACLISLGVGVLAGPRAVGVADDAADVGLVDATDRVVEVDGDAVGGAGRLGIASYS